MNKKLPPLKLKPVVSIMKKLFYKKPLKLWSKLKEKKPKKSKSNMKNTPKNNWKDKNKLNNTWLSLLFKPKKMKTTPSVTPSLKITTNKLWNQNVLMNSFQTKFHVQLKLLSVLNVVLNMSDLISCPPELNVFLHVTKSYHLSLYL